MVVPFATQNRTGVGKQIASHDFCKWLISFSINGGGSTAGFAQIIDGRIHIGMMSRELTAQEAQKLGSMRQITIALDAIVPVVSLEIYESGVQQISPATLAEIYRGQITNWKQVGGSNRYIITVDKNTYHGTRAVFANYVLASNDALESFASVVLNSDDDILRLVNSSDQAIGYVGIGYIVDFVRVLGLEINGQVIKPSHANIRSGAYPMSRKLYLLVPKAASGYVQDFLQFVLSSKGQDIVKQSGYLPLL